MTQGNSDSFSARWPAFADMPKEGPGTGLGSSPRLSNLGTAVVLSPEDYERARKALLAEDVMIRRGWNPSKSPLADTWRVDFNDGDYWCHPYTLDTIDDDPVPREMSDPFTILIAADTWMNEQEAKKS